MTKPSKGTRAVVRELNNIIHSRNLYHQLHGRCIHAHVSPFGTVVVERLHDGMTVPYVPGAFYDGYGSPVVC